MDWLIGTLSYAAVQANGIGAFSESVLEVSGALCDRQLGAALRQISGKFPLIHGWMARDWLNLAPYWKVSRRSRETVIPLQVVDLPEDQGDRARHLLDDHSNAPFEAEWHHLRALLVRVGQKRSFLGITFDHRLLDAYSSESIFRLIDETGRGRLDEISTRVRQTEPAHLNHWMRRFRSGRKLNRLLIRLAKRPACALVMPRPRTLRPARFVHDSLTSDESARFNQKAGEEIGVPIILPSAIARAVLALRHVFPSTPLRGTQYLVFTTANMRPPGQEWETFLFNHISFLPFSVDAQMQASTKQTAIGLRDQFFELMKAQVPRAMEDAATLGRICPHWLGSRLMRFIFGGRLCSFYFVCLRETGFSSETFLGLPALNLIHKPAVFSPPGLNICMTFFRGRFNLVISYMEGVIENSAATQLMRQFKALLLE
jgi:hypothetical protein